MARSTMKRFISRYPWLCLAIFCLLGYSIKIWNSKRYSEVLLGRFRDASPSTTKPRWKLWSAKTDMKRVFTCDRWQRKMMTKPATQKQADTDAYSIATYYSHRTKVNYFTDLPNSGYQMSVYLLAGEVGRRLRARYIIDLGCGNGFKLAKLAAEFTTIGIDFGVNIQTARASFPSLKWVEEDLAGRTNCRDYFPVDESVLKQSIVLSSDVIEHILKPEECYMHMLEYATRVSMGVIVSTPDRERLSGTYLLGPPSNPHHIREWRRSELIEFFAGYGMYPVRSGWVCNQQRPCDKPSTIILSLTAGMSQSLSYHTRHPGQLIINVFVIHLIGTETTLLTELIEELKQQGLILNLILFLNDNDDSLVQKQLSDQGVSVFHYKSVQQIPEMISSIAGGETGDSSISLPVWNVLLYSSEWIYIPGSGLGHPDQLGQFLCWLSKQNGGFSAVASTTLFHWVTPGNLTIYFDGLSEFNDYEEDIKPTSNPLFNNIRIWRSWSDKSLTLKFTTRTTNTGHEVLTGLSDQLVPLLRAYPYNLILVRVPPSEKNKRHGTLAEEVIDDGVAMIELNLGVKGLYNGISASSKYLF